MANKLNLNFDDGFKSIEINNDPSRVIKWNPADINFVDRFLALQHWVNNDFAALTESFDSGDFNVSTESGLLVVEGYTEGSYTELGEILNSKIDDAFGQGVSKAAFQGAHPMSPTVDGILFGNFVAALAPVIEESLNDNKAIMDKYINQSNNSKKKAKG